MENVNKYKLDALLITVTWLQNTVEGDTWLQASEFHKDVQEISNINRQDKRGGGIALLYSTKYKIKTVAHTKYSTFESRVWHIQFGSTLKKVIDTCIPAITRVINLSQDKGGFYANWKTAVVTSLIKAKTERHYTIKVLSG